MCSLRWGFVENFECPIVAAKWLKSIGVGSLVSDSRKAVNGTEFSVLRSAVVAGKDCSKTPSKRGARLLARSSLHLWECCLSGRVYPRGKLVGFGQKAGILSSEFHGNLRRECAWWRRVCAPRL